MSIRKYIDIVTESGNANISKIIKNLEPSRTGYYLTKKINIPISNTPITLDLVEMHRGIGERYVSFDISFLGELYDDLMRRHIARHVENLTKGILLDLGFSEEASNVSCYPEIFSKYDQRISIAFDTTSESYQKIKNELDRAIRYKKSMDDLDQ